MNGEVHDAASKEMRLQLGGSGEGSDSAIARWQAMFSRSLCLRLTRSQDGGVSACFVLLPIYMEPPLCVHEQAQRARVRTLKQQTGCKNLIFQTYEMGEGFEVDSFEVCTSIIVMMIVV